MVYWKTMLMVHYLGIIHCLLLTPLLWRCGNSKSTWFKNQHTSLVNILYLQVNLVMTISINSTALFYYMLGNISPKYRSSLKSIQLVAVAKSKDVSKYGIDRVLEPFMKDIQCLERVHVYTNNVHSKQLSYTVPFLPRMKELRLIYMEYLTSFMVSADNPARHLLGGYKNLTSALRKCRFCMATDLSVSVSIHWHTVTYIHAHNMS